MEEQTHHIVILDDDYHILSPYIDELECLGIKVSVSGDVSQFVEVVSKSEKVDLFIIDVMLPAGGSGFSELATDRGARTGLLVGKTLREKGIETPIIFFSVAWLDKAVSEIKNTEKRVSNSIYLKKQEVLPQELAEIAKAILSKGKVPGGLSKAYAKLVDSLLLKPSFFGVGVDFKKLFK